MRLILIMAMTAAASSAAYASSITEIGGSQKACSSIVRIDCKDCPAPQKKEARSGYKVPELAPGTQKFEVIEVGGEKKLARTEAWMGGSPVVFVGKLPPSMADDKAIAEVPAGKPLEAAIAEPTEDGVDEAAKTSAVPDNETSKGLSLDAFEIRKN